MSTVQPRAIADLSGDLRTRTTGLHHRLKQAFEKAGNVRDYQETLYEESAVPGQPGRLRLIVDGITSMSSDTMLSLLAAFGAGTKVQHTSDGSLEVVVPIHREVPPLGRLELVCLVFAILFNLFLFCAAEQRTQAAHSAAAFAIRFAGY